MVRICALNNYSLEKAWRLAAEGNATRQHIWGLDTLATRGHNVTIAPFHEPRERHLLQVATERTRNLLGHLDQEAYALSRARRFDTVYCADSSGLNGLALMNRILGRRLRLITVLHQPVRRVHRAALRRVDTAVCLSPTLAKEAIGALGIDGRRVVTLAWGPDIGSPLYRDSSAEVHGIVSTGKSNRDLGTLVKALERCDAPGLVYDLHAQVPVVRSDLIRLVRPGGPGLDPNSPGAYMMGPVMRDLAKAAVVAIPIADSDCLTGLTEVNDALALGKPIVMTRSAYSPVDPETVGCGITVREGDTDGWTRAIEHLMSDRQARLEMGRAGRAFAEREWNYDAFADGLEGVIAEIRR